jgi:hypothetical protein
MMISFNCASLCGRRVTGHWHSACGLALLTRAARPGASSLSLSASDSIDRDIPGET